MFSRSLILVLLGGISALFLHREQQRGLFAKLDAAHVRWLLDNRRDAVPRAEANVIFVRIDDRDRPEGERQFETWPLSAADWTGLLEEIATHRPGAVAVQPALGWGAAPDASLTKLAGGFPRAVFGVWGEAGAGSEAAPAAVPLAEITRIEGSRDAVPTFTSIPLGQEVGALGTMALTHLDLSDDPAAKAAVHDRECRIPLLFRHGDRVYPSFLLHSLCLDLGISLAEIEVRLGNAVVLQNRIRLPIDRAGGFVLHLLPVNEAELPTLNLDTFKLDAAQLDRFLPKGDPVRSVLPKVPGALLWIAQDDSAARRLPLADGRTVSAAELAARALLAMETGRNIAPLAERWQAAACGAAVLLCVWQGRFQRRHAWKFGLLAAVGLGMVSLLTFQTWAVWLPLGPCLGILAAGTAANAILRRESAPPASA
ncbi:MAG: CHASE2 domain-containing protein [Verrucomicrobiales bacterium]|nr:CHASE2 domain-containing protein [Verrucomicrobiales bacterium]